MPVSTIRFPPWFRHASAVVLIRVVPDLLHSWSCASAIIPPRGRYARCIVASNAFDLDTGVLNILKILPQLVQPLAVSQPIEERHADIRVAVKHQAGLIREVCAVNQQIDFFAALNMPHRADWKERMKVTLQMADTITTALGELLDALFANNPISKPNQLIVCRNVRAPIQKITITEGAIVTLESPIMTVMLGLKKTAVRAANSTLFRHKNRD